MTHFTAHMYLLHSLVSLFVRLLTILTEALRSILLLATKRVWHIAVGHNHCCVLISIGHDHCCVLYIITSWSCVEWPLHLNGVVEWSEYQVLIPQILCCLMFWLTVVRNFAHVLSVLCLQWMCDVSDRTGDSNSKMFCCILTAESGRCGAHITVVWCWPWSAECKRPKCCRCGDFWADATNLYWGTSTCNRKFWVSLLDVGDGAVLAGKWLLVLWMGFRICVVCCGGFEYVNLWIKLCMWFPYLFIQCVHTSDVPDHHPL
jgi:hypothetical protein